ncbi:MAG: hypothetical protein AAFR54_10160 [Planctomycetota bacterium]
MKSTLLLAPLLASALALPSALPQDDPPGVAQILGVAERRLQQGDLDGARERIRRAQERDAKSLAAWDLRARWAAKAGDTDERTYSLHNLMRLAVAQGRPKAEIEAIRERLYAVDPIAPDLVGMRLAFLEQLFEVAERYADEDRPHGAIRVYKQVLALDPENARAQSAIEELASSPDPSLAGDAKPKDLFADVTVEWIEEFDAEHNTWKTKAKLERDNYVTYTDAGYEVLVRTAEAMEQMNAFYRQFFQYGTEEDGGAVPRIDVNVFKNRDGYLKLGIGPPVEWSGGHFTGGAVETYIGGGGFSGMTGTLFHEAAHQFVSLATTATGWLNEGLASFFEGTRILPNGTVIMNMPATHRLIPLAERMERGWMSAADDGIDPDDPNTTPERAPTFAIILENFYQWGPPWYAPTWGVVYFLYNYQDPIDGRFVYRAAFQTFINKSGGRVGPGAVRNFEEVVLANPLPPLDGVERPEDAPDVELPETAAELDAVWKKWTLRLRDETTGAVEVTRPYKDWGRYAVLNEDYINAKEHFEKGLVEDPGDVELLGLFADLLAEHLDDEDRASKLLLEAIQRVEENEPVDEDLLARLEKRYGKLDPNRKRLGAVMDELRAASRGIVERYKGAGLDLMAMDVSWRLGTELGISDLLLAYEEIVRRTDRTTDIWRLAYNEQNLEGWNAQGTDRVFEPASVDLSGDFGTFSETAYDFSSLTLDTVAGGDFSMSARVQAPKGKVNFCGFVFGQKTDNTFHSMILFPERTKVAQGVATTGFVDLMSNFGGTTKTWRHVPVDVSIEEGASSADRYYDMRLDVSGRVVDLWFDGDLVASHEFPNTDVVRGRFGLLMGPGAAKFRDVRYLARDPRDPAGAIRRERKLEELRAAGDGAVGGSYLGLRPPFPSVEKWVSGDARSNWSDVGPVPQLLVFFSIGQNDTVAIDGWLRDLAEKHADAGLEIVAVTSPEDGDSIEAYLEGNEFPGSVGVDTRPPGTFGIGDSFEKFSIARFNLPRLLLLDIDGRVVWEGDPGFSANQGYAPGATSYLDAPLDELLVKRRIPELIRWRAAWESDVLPDLAVGDFAKHVPTLIAAEEFDPELAPEAGRAAGRLAAVRASLAGIARTTESIQTDEAEPALVVLREWATALEHEFDADAKKAFKKIGKGKSMRSWTGFVKDVEKFESSKGSFEDKAGRLMKKLEKRNGLFPRLVKEDLEGALADGDEAWFTEVLRDAPNRPAVWLSTEFFAWR